MKKVELLAPAGSFDALRAAVNAGADAVYMGGSRFGARAYADNPDEDGLVRAIEFCHLRGKKLYLTVNTLFKESELYDGLYDFLKPYYEAGLDAVIVQDAGAVRYIARRFPGLDIHLSTQCTITMAEGAKEIEGHASQNGITRLVPARELSLEELTELRKNTGLEIEVFIHGALCYCFSGQCLLSSMAGGRSGNRGRCAQPCRKLYTAGANSDGYNSPDGASTKTEGNGKVRKRGYFLSPKDMCALPYIHSMIEAGIDSFKIEGRMKSPEYVAGVVSEYRSFIDRYYELGKEGYEKWLRENGAELEKAVDRLRELYNRGGFNNGYLYQHNGREMMSLARPNHSGVRIGEVVKCEGRKAYIRLSSAVNKGDVLEIRNSRTDNYAKKSITDEFVPEKAIYEFTAGEAYNSGVQFSVLTMKDRTAAPGLEVYRTKNAFLLEAINEKYLSQDCRIPVSMHYYAAEGCETELTLSTASGQCVTVNGNVPDIAKNAPTTEEAVVKQLKKLGDTELEAISVVTDIRGKLFIPVGELNRLRREAAGRLRECILDGYRRKLSGGTVDCSDDLAGIPVKENSDGIGTASGTVNDRRSRPEISVLASTPAQLKEVLRHGFVDTVCFDISGYKYGIDFSLTDQIAEMCSTRDRRLIFALPPIIRCGGTKRLEAFIRHYLDETGFLIRNREELELLKQIRAEKSSDGENTGAVSRTDYNIYVMNTMAAECAGMDYTVSPELNATELGTVAGDRAQLIIYGLIPVMYSAQCVHKNVYGKCTDGTKVSLTDEKGYCFPTAQICGDCYNIIYNSSVLNLIHRLEEVDRIGFGSLRLNFTFESESETRLVLDCLQNVLEGKKYIMPDEIMGMKFTNGHFNRGVE